MKDDRGGYGMYQSADSPRKLSAVLGFGVGTDRSVLGKVGME